MTSTQQRAEYNFTIDAANDAMFDLEKTWYYRLIRSESTAQKAGIKMILFNGLGVANGGITAFVVRRDIGIQAISESEFYV